MVIRYSFLLLSFIIFGCSSQPKNCDKFKIGTFKYTAPEFQNITVVRNDSMQIETDSKLGSRFESSIKWLSDCKYSVTILSVNKKQYNSIIGNTLNIDITSITDKGYKYNSYENDTLKNVGEMVKIEN